MYVNKISNLIYILYTQISQSSDVQYVYIGIDPQIFYEIFIYTTNGETYLYAFDGLVL